MTQALQYADKRCGRVAHRSETCVGIPQCRSARVQITAQCVVTTQSTLHALQVSRRLAGAPSQAIDHGVAGATYGQAWGRPRQRDRYTLAQIESTDAACCLTAVCRIRVDDHAGAVTSCRDLGIDIDIIRRRQGQRCVGAPGHCIVDINVTRACRMPRGALQSNAGVGQVRRQRCARDVTATGGYCVILRVNQPGAITAAAGGCRHSGAVRYLHMCCRSFDKAAVATRQRTGVKRTAKIHGARRHTAEQSDRAAVLLHAARFN